MTQQLADWRWTRGYVEDVAAAIALAVTDDKAQNRIYNVGELNAMTSREWVEKIGEAAGWEWQIAIVPDNKLPDHLKPGSNLAQHLVTDTGRIRSELGYKEAVTVEDAVKRTIEWEKHNPPEKYDPAVFNYAAEDAVILYE